MKWRQLLQWVQPLVSKLQPFKHLIIQDFVLVWRGKQRLFWHFYLHVFIFHLTQDHTTSSYAIHNIVKYVPLSWFSIQMMSSITYSKSDHKSFFIQQIHSIRIMDRSAKFQTPPIAVDLLWSCEGLWRGLSFVFSRSDCHLTM